MKHMAIKIKCPECHTETVISLDATFIDSCPDCAREINYDKINTQLLLRLIDFFGDMIELSNKMKGGEDDE